MLRFRQQLLAPSWSLRAPDARPEVAACNAFSSVRYVRLPKMLDELTVNKGEEWLKMKLRYL